MCGYFSGDVIYCLVSIQLTDKSDFCVQCIYDSLSSYAYTRQGTGKIWPIDRTVGYNVQTMHNSLYLKLPRSNTAFFPEI